MGDNKGGNLPKQAELPGVHILWITAALGCDGDSVSMTAATQPSIEDLVDGVLPGVPQIHFHHPLLAYENGDEFLNFFYQAQEGKLDPFILVVEGSIPNEKNKAEGYWAAMGTDKNTGQPILTCDWIDRLAPKAWAVVCAGTCSAYGGIHAMQGNPTGCMGLADYLGWDWQSKGGLRIVNVPGCPIQPDNFMEVLVHLLRQYAGNAPMIALDEQLRPRSLFEQTVHEGCDRGGFYEQGDFSEKYGKPQCIVKLGCWGPVVNCNVGKRGWMNGIGGCPNVGGVCIGCTMPGFPDKFMPFMDEPPGAKLSTSAVAVYGRSVRAAEFHPGIDERGTAVARTKSEVNHESISKNDTESSERNDAEPGVAPSENGEALLAGLFGNLRNVPNAEFSKEHAEAVLAALSRASGSKSSGAKNNADLLSAPTGQEHFPSQYAAELRYRALVDNIPAVTFIAALDRESHEFYVSPQIEQLLGFTQEEWSANPFLWYYRVHIEDRDRWGEEFARTCATGDPFKAEYRMVARDDRVVWIHAECQVIRDKQDIPRFLQGIAWDVTDTKRAEELLRQSNAQLEARVQERTEALNEANRALRSEIVERERIHRQVKQQNRDLQRAGEALQESEALLRSVLETAAEAIITIDAQGPILSFNAAATKIFGYSLPEVLGKDIKMITPDPSAWKRVIGGSCEMDALRKDGTTIRVELSVSEMLLDQRRIFTGIIRDISERKRFEEELRRSRELAVHASLHDTLTKLPNRALLLDRVAMALERRRRNPDYHFALLYLDFDRFKVINDSLGHEIGDELLVSISKRLLSTLRVTDSISAPNPSTAARIGGDEFVLLIDDLADVRDVAIVAERLLRSFAEPYTLRGHTIKSAVSIGVTTSDVGYKLTEDMLRDADTAMYQAKVTGKGRYVIFDQKMHQDNLTRIKLENDLRLALERGEFFLQYQPIVSLATRGLLGFEALVRWKHPERGIVSPGEFISCCEDNGLIVPLGEWVLAEGCRQLADWQRRIPEAISIYVSINLSTKQLLAPGIVDRVQQIIKQNGANPQSVILEITESAVIQNMDVAIPVLELLCGLGVRLYMDDFGTGYSSLSCLHRFPLKGLKIDRSFITSVAERRDYAAIISAIAALARNLDMILVGEGLETSEQVVMLQTMDCNAAQGYFFSRPMHAVDAEKFMLNSTAASS